MGEGLGKVALASRRINITHRNDEGWVVPDGHSVLIWRKAAWLKPGLAATGASRALVMSPRSRTRTIAQARPLAERTAADDAGGGTKYEAGKV